MQQLFVQYSCVLYGNVDRTIKLIVQKLSFRRYGHIVANGEKAAKGLQLYTAEDTFLVFFRPTSAARYSPDRASSATDPIPFTLSLALLCSHSLPAVTLYVTLSLCHSVTLSLYLSIYLSA